MRTVLWRAGAAPESGSRGSGRLLQTLLVAVALSSCTPATPPSLLLFVLDTTRRDAVSAYGEWANTTPTLDALAADGLRYAHAYAQAPWTLPSHATLFTGLLPAEHGVNWRRTMASDDLVTLAEVLADAGYETAAFSENPWVGPAANLVQGFEHYARIRPGPTGLEEALSAWLAGRRSQRPIFLFVNVLDAHYPYRGGGNARFLPPEVGLLAALRFPQDVEDYLCTARRRRAALRVLRGLYLGDVSGADAKLGRVLELLRDADAARSWIRVVTSDHGEHFGEHSLVSHQFSVREGVLRVPLVVHGLPDVRPAVIQEPVQLADVMPSLLHWAGVPAPAGLRSRVLPSVADAELPPRAIVAEFAEPEAPALGTESDFSRKARRRWRAVRVHCEPEDRVFGAMRALVRYPMKLVWFERHPPQLYDLSQDDGEQRDLAAERPRLLEELVAELDRVVEDAARVAPGVPPPTPMDADTLRELEALGYLEAP
ncbi:MAG: sulfatase [Deltaproteobacteria bacterium]|nr:MAG: sulfatase [Deltaproteobacteria bacterium]